jgi:hypothetical protein
MDTKSNKISDNEVPLFRKWRTWYLLVLGNHLLLIILFYLFMKYFG